MFYKKLCASHSGMSYSNFMQAMFSLVLRASNKKCKGDVLRLRQVGGLVTKRHAQLHFGRVGVETAVTCFLIFLVLF